MTVVVFLCGTPSCRGTQMVMRIYKYEQMRSKRARYGVLKYLGLVWVVGR